MNATIRQRRPGNDGSTVTPRLFRSHDRRSGLVAANSRAHRLLLVRVCSARSCFAAPFCLMVRCGLAMTRYVSLLVR